MSIMNAIAGFNAAMYVKFCSGPTPTYARPGSTVLIRSGMTCWSQSSFDTRLSDRKFPSCSERSEDSRQNSWSESRLGNPLAGVRASARSGSASEVNRRDDRGEHTEPPAQSCEHSIPQCGRRIDCTVAQSGLLGCPGHEDTKNTKSLGRFSDVMRDHRALTAQPAASGWPRTGPPRGRGADGRDKWCSASTRGAVRGQDPPRCVKTSANGWPTDSAAVAS